MLMSTLEAGDYGYLRAEEAERVDTAREKGSKADGPTAGLRAIAEMLSVKGLAWSALPVQCFAANLKSFSPSGRLFSCHDSPPQLFTTE